MPDVTNHSVGIDMSQYVLQAPDSAQERCGKPAKEGYEGSEQAAVSTPPISDIGLTPRKRNHGVMAGAAAQTVGSAGGSASKSGRLQALSEEPSAGAVDAMQAAHNPTSVKAAPAMLYVHAARGAYEAAPAPPQRAPAPSLLGPASKPLDITLHVRRCSRSTCTSAHLLAPLAGQCCRASSRLAMVKVGLVVAGSRFQVSARLEASLRS